MIDQSAAPASAAQSVRMFFEYPRLVWTLGRGSGSCSPRQPGQLINRKMRSAVVVNWVAREEGRRANLSFHLLYYLVVATGDHIHV